MGSIGAASVKALLRGRRYAGAAVPIDDPEEAMAGVEQATARYGRKGAAGRMGVALDTMPPPFGEEIPETMQGHAVIRIRRPAPISAG